MTPLSKQVEDSLLTFGLGSMQDVPSTNVGVGLAILFAPSLMRS